jgi:hypothetical protein
MATMIKVFCTALLIAGLQAQPLFALDKTAQLHSAGEMAHHPEQADFLRENPSRDTRHIADWVINSGDNRTMPFLIIDKVNARLFAFNAGGHLLGAAPVLLGMARGDDSTPGIGNRKLSSIRPDERTTPAGRFVSSLGRNLSNKTVLWVDYDNAVSIHQVITSNPREHRLQRLASPTPLDNRISSGCINLPAGFFRNVVLPLFRRTNGIVYVLPEIRSLREVFGLYDVGEPVTQRHTGTPAFGPFPAELLDAGKSGKFRE